MAVIKLIRKKTARSFAITVMVWRHNNFPKHSEKKTNKKSNSVYRRQNGITWIWHKHGSQIPALKHNHRHHMHPLNKTCRNPGRNHPPVRVSSHAVFLFLLATHLPQKFPLRITLASCSSSDCCLGLHSCWALPPSHPSTCSSFSFLTLHTHQQQEDKKYFCSYKLEVSNIHESRKV